MRYDNAQDVRYKGGMQTDFQRARSAASKQQRAASLVEAARSIAMADGVRAVTLTGIAARAGVHHSAVRRYFDSHREVLLHLAADGWTRWADAVADRLDGGPGVGPAQLASVLVETLAADPLTCDLFAHVPMHLEHDVPVAKVLEFKRTSFDAVEHIRDAIARALPQLGTEGALDVVTAANAMAATLWQVTHPRPELTAAAAASGSTAFATFEQRDFTTTLSRLLAATVTGLVAADVGIAVDPHASEA